MHEQAPDAVGSAPIVESLTGGGRTAVFRSGQMVLRQSGPWSPTVIALLRHLEAVGYSYSPRVVGEGLDENGMETLSFIPGEFMHPGPWTLDGVAAVGAMLRDLHRATASFVPPPGAVWRTWFGRSLGHGRRVIGHCDAAPWNIVSQGGLPVALIDWETAGPVNPLVELAQAVWLNAQLHDDIVAARVGLPPLAERARQFRAIVDAYGLTAQQRRGFLDQIVEFVVFDTAEQADEAGVMPETVSTTALWGLAWRARAGAWILRNRLTFGSALA